METGDERARMLDELSAQFEQLGLTPIAGRILSYLLISEEPSQSSVEIAEAIDSSRGSVSTQTQVLEARGLVERFRRTGSREVYFRVHPQILLDLIRQQARLAERLRDLTEMAIEQQGLNQRLDEFHSVNAFLAERLPDLIEEWRQERRKRRPRLIDP